MQEGPGGEPHRNLTVASPETAAAALWAATGTAAGRSGGSGMGGEGGDEGGKCGDCKGGSGRGAFPGGYTVWGRKGGWDSRGGQGPQTEGCGE